MKIYVVTCSYRKDDTIELFWSLDAAKRFVDKSFETPEAIEFYASEWHPMPVWEHWAQGPLGIAENEDDRPIWVRGERIIRARAIHGGPLTALAMCAKD